MISETELIYLMDPQCGWCYGFSGTIREIVDHYKSDEHLKMSLVTGGLFVPARITGPGFADEKRPIAKRVSRHFGVEFSEDYFQNVLGSGRLDSLIPCKVINAVKIKYPDRVFEFAAQLIDFAFTQGRNISELSVCLDIAAENGFNSFDIEAILQTKALKKLTEQSFQFAQNMGTGFPSIFLKRTEDLTHLGGVNLNLRTLIDRIKL